MPLMLLTDKRFLFRFTDGERYLNLVSFMVYTTMNGVYTHRMNLS